MLKTLWMVLLGVGLAMGPWAPGWAMEVPPEKIKAYAEIYPEVFQSAFHNVAYRPATGGNKNRAVTLLLESYNGNTDVDGLSSALNTPREEPTLLKTDSQIKSVLATKGLRWDEYVELTHRIAKDPALFEAFSQQIDHQRLQRDVLSRAYGDKQFLRLIQSMDHQIIVRNLLANMQ